MFCEDGSQMVGGLVRMEAPSSLWVTFLNLFSLSLAVLSSSSVVRRWVYGI